MLLAVADTITCGDWIPDPALGTAVVCVSSSISDYADLQTTCESTFVSSILFISKFPIHFLKKNSKRGVTISHQILRRREKCIFNGKTMPRKVI